MPLIQFFVFCFFLFFIFAVVGYESFYFLFNKKLTILNVFLINLFVFYMGMFVCVITIFFVQMLTEMWFFCTSFKHVIYGLFHFKITTKIFYLVFLKKINIVVVFVFFILFFSFIGSYIQYIYIKNENNSSTDVFTQFSGFFDLFFKYLTVLSISLSFILVFI